MTRYTINIGDDFPLGGDDGPAAHRSGHPRHRRRRHGLLLRALFFLAVAAIVIAHPLKTLLVVGVVLLVSRSPRFAAFRHQMRETVRAGLAHDWRHEAQQWRDSVRGWQSRMGGGCGRRRPETAEAGEEPDRYRGFV